MVQYDKVQPISIHALLAESDPFAVDEVRHVGNFYPRSPCGERHLQIAGCPYTRSYFYPRSPCGERLQLPAI